MEQREKPKPQGVGVFFWVVVILVIGAMTAFYFYERAERDRGNWPTGHNKSNFAATREALERYQIDWAFYPPATPLRAYVKRQEVLRQAGAWNLGGIPSILTTPVPYTEKLLGDPDAPEWDLPFAYYTNGNHYILYSPGRDHTYDILDPAAFLAAGGDAPPDELLLITYDPYNGKVSRGDRWYSNRWPDFPKPIDD